MKRLFIMIGLILILFSSILMVSAIDNNYTIPEGYHIVNESDNFTILESDKYHTISISTLDNGSDKDVLKYMLEKSMYDFTYEKNYTKGSFDIEENYYSQEYQRGILYFCDNGDELIVIDYKVPVIEEVDDSPVGVILDSICD